MVVAPVVYTDATGWPIHGEGAQLMAFDTGQATVFQIRSQHRNEEVRELPGRTRNRGFQPTTRE